MDYNRLHAERAALHSNVPGGKVLVVGCNTGLDCTYFVEMGAQEVHGVDVVDGIGQDFQNERVTYHKVSAEAMHGLEGGYFDLVYSFATMEHVPDIAAAFSEMGRVTARGGTIYSIASPLWHSRHGHHFPQYFADYPWAHLRMTPESAYAYLVSTNALIAPEHTSARIVADYMFDRANFNMRRAEEYTSACAKLNGFDLVLNTLDMEPDHAIPADLETDLTNAGYSKIDLLAVTHALVAKNRRRWWQWSTR